ncbi:MAG TPA: hypothetical protein VF015_03490 [Acidimicrobiales bacterium]
MSSYTMKSVRWLAPLALVGVVGLAACGDETASEAAVGSGNRAALAAEAERYVDLQQGRAGERGVEPSGSDSGPNVFEAGNRAAAEALAQPD